MIKGIAATVVALGLNIVMMVNVSAQEFATTPDYAMNILLNDTLGAHLSREAKQIIGRPFSPSQQSTQDNQRGIHAYLMSPRVVDVLSFKSLSITAPKYELTPLARNRWEQRMMDAELERASNSQFSQYTRQWQEAELIRERAMLTNPKLADIMVSQLPGPIVAEQLEDQGYQGQLAHNDLPQIQVDNSNIVGEQVERKYWWHKFEGSIHFSQNQVSKNWHRGGFNSLNLNTRIYYNATYTKDKIKWVNELEYRLGVFTNVPEGDEKMKLKIGEDIFRVNTNLGIKAIQDWYYTVDAQLRSQLLKNTTTEGMLVTRPFAPITLDAGIGMKYDIDKKEFRGNPFARFKFTANIAPAALNFIYTYTDDIDKGRIGLQPDQKYRLRLGSSLRVDLSWDFSSSLNWTSRLFFNTSYKHMEIELDNSLNYAFSRFFSARLALNTRFDDSVILSEDTPKTFNNLIQYNQLLSLGFAYKI